LTTKRKPSAFHEAIEIDVRILKTLLSYNSENGELIWKESLSSRAVRGGKAGSLLPTSTKKYIRVGVCGKSLLAHRVCWAIHFGSWPAGDIDHIDGDGTNNSINNLRVVTITENCKNIRIRKSNLTGVIGVYKHPLTKKWGARIGVNRRRVHLGYFSDFSAACEARKLAEVKFGFHNNHGRKGE
jgi:hypothetical protein